MLRALPLLGLALSFAACSSSPPKPTGVTAVDKTAEPTAPPLPTPQEYLPPPPEVLDVLGKLSASLRTYVNDNGDGFPSGRTVITPARPCCGQPGNICEPSLWDEWVWQTLAFSWDHSTEFQYRYQATSRSFTLTATGDPNCLGEQHVYQITGSSGRGQDVKISEIGMVLAE